MTSFFRFFRGGKEIREFGEIGEIGEIEEIEEIGEIGATGNLGETREIEGHIAKSIGTTLALRLGRWTATRRHATSPTATLMQVAQRLIERRIFSFCLKLSTSKHDVRRTK